MVEENDKKPIIIESNLADEVESGKYVAIMITLKGTQKRIVPRDQLIYLILGKIYAMKNWDPNEPFLSVEMPCGQKVVYEKSSDIPWASVPCPCGNPGHWVIEYNEE